LPAVTNNQANQGFGHYQRIRRTAGKLLDYRSPEAAAYRKLYKTALWHRTRDTVLKRDGYLCQWCKPKGYITIASVCHHMDKASKENPDTFFAGPFIALCKPCHDSEAQGIEVRGFSNTVGQDGWPTDDRHPANR
jgi:5-methylcytosine-specific restriction protein A